MLQPGVEVGAGFTLAHAFVTEPGENEFYLLPWYGKIFNRFEPGKYFYAEAGFGAASEWHLTKSHGLEDGWGWRPVTFAYVQPMVGGRIVKFGIPVYAGTNGSFVCFVTSPVLRFHIAF